MSHEAFRTNLNFDWAELEERHTRVSRKVTADADLVRRAMLFLDITGEVLCPQYAHAPALAERVFLRPQWIIDVMKELVHHDLHTQVEQVDPAQQQVRDLGQLFCVKGVLDRRLLPWLWRNLPFPLSQKDDEISFLLELLT